MVALSNELCRLGHSLNGFVLAAERLSLSHIAFISAWHTAYKALLMPLRRTHAGITG